jgi:hypothetical protein
MVILRVVGAMLAVLWAMLLVLVGGRFLLLLFDGNSASELVQWVFRKSEFWVEPLFGVGGLENMAIDRTGGVFEPASLIALVIYTLIGMLLIGLLNWSASGTYWRTPVRV